MFDDSKLNINRVFYDLQTPTHPKCHEFYYVHLFFPATSWGTRDLNGCFHFFQLAHFNYNIEHSISTSCFAIPNWVLLVFPTAYKHRPIVNTKNLIMFTYYFSQLTRVLNGLFYFILIFQ